MKSWQITSNSHCGFFQLHLKVSRWEVRRHNFNSSFSVSVCGGFLFCFLRFGWVGWRCTGYENFLKIFPSMPASWPFNRWPFLVLYTLSTVFSWQSLLAKDNDTGQAWPLLPNRSRYAKQTQQVCFRLCWDARKTRVWQNTKKQIVNIGKVKLWHSEFKVKLNMFTVITQIRSANEHIRKEKSPQNPYLLRPGVKLLNS